MSARTIKKKQQEPVILTKRRKDDPFEQLFKELFKELNKYGAHRFVQAQGNVPAERALPLLENRQRRSR